MQFTYCLVYFLHLLICLIILLYLCTSITTLSIYLLTCLLNYLVYLYLYYYTIVFFCPVPLAEGRGLNLTVFDASAYSVFHTGGILNVHGI